MGKQIKGNIEFPYLILHRKSRHVPHVCGSLIVHKHNQQKLIYPIIQLEGNANRQSATRYLDCYRFAYFHSAWIHSWYFLPCVRLFLLFCSGEPYAFFIWLFWHTNSSMPIISILKKKKKIAIFHFILILPCAEIVRCSLLPCHANVDGDTVNFQALMYRVIETPRAPPA